MLNLRSNDLRSAPMETAHRIARFLLYELTPLSDHGRKLAARNLTDSVMALRNAEVRWTPQGSQSCH